MTYAFDAIVGPDGLGVERWLFNKSEILIGVTIEGEPIPVTETASIEGFVNTHGYEISSDSAGLKPGDRYRCVWVTERRTPSTGWPDYIGSDALELSLWRLSEFKVFASPSCQDFVVSLDIPDDWLAFWANSLGSGGPLRVREFAIPRDQVEHLTLLFAGPFIRIGEHGPVVVYGFGEDAEYVAAIMDVVADEHESIFKALGPGGVSKPLALSVALFHHAPGVWGVGAAGVAVVNCPAGDGVVAALRRLIGHELVHCYLNPNAGLNYAAGWINEGLATYVDRLAKDSPWAEVGPQVMPRDMAASLHTVAEVSADLGDLRQQYSRDLIYNKPAWIMRMLHSMMGDSFLEACVAFSNLEAAQPLTEQDFIYTISRYAGQDLGWFFEQWVHTTKTAWFKLDPPSVRAQGDAWLLSGAIENSGGAHVPRVTIAVSSQSGSLASVPCLFEAESRRSTFEVLIPKWTTSVTISVDPDLEVLLSRRDPGSTFTLGWYAGLRIGAALIVLACGGLAINRIDRATRKKGGRAGP